MSGLQLVGDHCPSETNTIVAVSRWIFENAVDYIPHKSENTTGIL